MSECDNCGLVTNDLVETSWSVDPCNVCRDCARKIDPEWSA